MLVFITNFKFVVTLAGGNFFGLHGRASATGEYSSGIVRGLSLIHI